MGSPILQPITSRPTPIVAQRGNSEIAGVLNMGIKGAQVMEQMEQKEDNEYTAEFAKRVRVIETAVLNGGMSRAEGIKRVQAIESEMLGAEGREHLFQNFNAVSKSFETDSGISYVEAQRAAEQEARAAALEAEIKQFEEHDINPDDPDRWAKLETAQTVKSLLADQTRRNELRAAQQLAREEDYRREGFAAGNVLFTDFANKYSGIIGTSEKAWLAKSKDDTDSLLLQMKEDVRVARQKIRVYSPYVSAEDEKRMLANLEEEYQFFVDMVNGDVTFQQYKRRNEYNSVVAKNILAPTPQAAAFNTLRSEMLNSRNANLWLSLVKSPGLMKALEAHGESFLMRLVGEAPENFTTLSMIEDKEQRSAIASELLTAFDTYDSEIPPELSNMLHNITRNMTVKPELFNADAWDAAIAFAGGEKAAKMKDDPLWSNVLGAIDKGVIDNYASLLLQSAKRDIPDGAELFMNDQGQLELRETENTHIYNKMDNNFLREGEYEDWYEDYGTRINNLAQAGTTIRGGTLEENYKKMVEIGGLVSAPAPESEPVQFTEFEQSILDEIEREANNG